MITRCLFQGMHRGVLCRLEATLGLVQFILSAVVHLLVDDFVDGGNVHCGCRLLDLNPQSSIRAVEL